jgi:hypothetical protein
MHSVHQGSAIELQLILPRSQSGLTAAEQQDQWLSKQQCVGVTADMTSWIASQAYTTALCSWHRTTIRELSEELGLSFGLVQSILTEDTGMKRISAKFVPKQLTVESLLVQNFLTKHQIP